MTIRFVSFQYDRLGRQKVAQTFLSAHRYAYAPVTLALASETIIDPQNAVTNVITRTTDTLGRDTGFSLGDDYAVVYGYDDFGRFHSVSSTVASAKSEATYGYLAGSDLLAAMTNSWGFSWTRAFETNRNLIASVENRFGENLISAFGYANDSLARRTRRVDNLTVTNDFGYNVRSEVIDALMGTNTYSYAYDPTRLRQQATARQVGNRLAATNNQEGWVYQSNPLNQYTNIAVGVIVEPEYDLDGNMTATGDGWWYVWNGENRMILASNATTVVTYAYDHQGRMVAKTVDDVARQYLWDGYNIVSSVGTVATNWFVWGLDLSGSLQGAGGIGGLLAEIQDREPYFAAFDANGNVTEYVSTNGVTEAHYEYSPFGEIVTKSGEMVDSFTHRFSTKPWCGVTGLSEYEYRKYHSSMGRWLSRDPIGEMGLRITHRAYRRGKRRTIDNLFVMSANRPISTIDYLGLLIEVTGDCGCPSAEALKSIFRNMTAKKHYFDTVVSGIRDPFKTAIISHIDSMTFECKSDKQDPECKGNNGHSPRGTYRDIIYSYSKDGYEGEVNETKNWETSAVLCRDSLQKYGMSSWIKTIIHETAHAIGWGGHYDDEDDAFDNMYPNMKQHPNETGWGIPRGSQ